MANHKSSIKRIRSNEAKRLRNRYQLVTARTFIKKLLTTKVKTEGVELLPKVVAILDKLAKNNIIHKHNASNHKSKLTKHVNALAA